MFLYIDPLKQGLKRVYPRYDFENEAGFYT